MSSPNELDLGDERAFGLDELFFSRTDEGGIILAGNSVFQRISAYSWDEMIRKPHKLIRHPDMPRAVFWLLWHTIKSGQPIGAYVKNKAKDGRFYWVYAIVTPIEGGYLSVRLKPSSELFQVVKNEYQGLVALEAREGLAPAESAKLLLARLGELGFPDYGAFMAATLSRELAVRDEQLGRRKDRTVALFSNLSESAKALHERASAIAEAYTRNGFVPLNFQIQAVQLGREGASIGEISNNYNTISLEIRRNMDRFMESAGQVVKTVQDGLFLVCTAKVQEELLAFFNKEAPSNGAARDVESALLDAQRQAYRRKARLGLDAIAKQADQFRQDCGEMRRSAAGLEVTRIMGKVECARLTVAKDGLSELLDDLEAFHTTIAGSLKEIDRMNERIQCDTDQLLASQKAA